MIRSWEPDPHTHGVDPEDTQEGATQKEAADRPSSGMDCASTLAWDFLSSRTVTELCPCTLCVVL